MITITLKYVGKQPVIKGLKRVSKPGLRIYSNAQELPKVMKGPGCGHHLHFQGDYDRPGCKKRKRRRRSAGVHLVRKGVREHVENWKKTHQYSRWC